MMVTRANGMAKGGVGVRMELVRAFVDALNAGVHPVVRLGGSVGQADLAEMAEIGQVLIGRGEADYEGRRMPGAEALAAAGLQPARLKAKEGLALISANGVTMGHGFRREPFYHTPRGGPDAAPPGPGAGRGPAAGAAI
jgi:histidine ammonia-lyase